MSLAQQPFKAIPIMYAPVFTTILYLRPSASDLSNISSTEPAVRRALVAEIKHACMEVGFFYGRCLLHHNILEYHLALVKNHGIPQEVMQQTLTQMTRFFDLPLEEKLEVVSRVSFRLSGFHLGCRWKTRKHQTSWGTVQCSRGTMTQTAQAISRKGSSSNSRLSTRTNLNLGPIMGHRQTPS